MSIRNRNSLPLDPKEWDFRGLNPEHLRAALMYEVTRERSAVREVMPLLTIERRKEIETLTEGDWKRWKPDWIEKSQFYSILRACWFCGEFPAPWMALSDTQRATAVEKYGRPAQPLRILTPEELSQIEFMERMLAEVKERLGGKQSSAENTFPIRRYVIQIDWSYDDPVLKPALSELLKLRPKGTRPLKRHTGKRSAPPLHKIKQLAAWRLATKAHLNYKEAQQLVDARKKKCPRPGCVLDLLPTYTSAGAWHDAVEAGRKLVVSSLRQRPPSIREI